MSKVTTLEDEQAWTAETTAVSGPEFGSADASGFLDLFDIERGQLVRVSFARRIGTAHFQVAIGDAAYCALITARTSLCPPGNPPAFGVTAIAGGYAGSDRGSILIVINCAQDLPTLQIAARSSSESTRSWSLRITHDIQHRILNILA